VRDAQRQPETTGPIARAVPVARRFVALAMTAAMLTVAGCSDDDSDTDATDTGCRTLAADPAWYGDNRDQINGMIDELGTCGKLGAVADGAPLALFDWDNTTVKQDIGNATFFWMVRNSKVRQPAAGNWSTTSEYLTSPAAAALAAACGALSAPGQPLPTGTDTGCARRAGVGLHRRPDTFGCNGIRRLQSPSDQTR
jgi:hypothetical protein